MSLTTKEIISIANKQLLEAFELSDGSATLEEISFNPDKKQWSVTFSFVEKRTALPSPLRSLLLPDINNGYERRYKVVTIDESGNFLSIKKHEID